MKREFVMQEEFRPVERRIVSFLLALSMCFYILPAGSWTVESEVMPLASYSGGSGTKADPYLISTREDLETIAAAVNGGNELHGVYFEQTGNIDLGGEDDPWTVIGHVVGNTPHPFSGVYNGGDHNIYGLFVGTTDEEGEPVGEENEDAGLFGHVGKDGIIRRVHVVDCQVYNKALYVGGIAGRNEGLVEYCSSDATDPDNSSGVVKGSWQYAGGIVGYNFGTISYCYSNCDVYGAQKVGGITGGQNGGTVVNCYFRGYVYADDITRAYAGGIAGENDGNSTIDNCYSDGLIEGRNENAYCGSIAGSNDTGSKVENCFWDDSEETGLPGIGSGMGTVEKVEERTSDEFSSGQVAWELSKGTNGDGWGQSLTGDSDDKIDKHPHFVDAPDKDHDTTLVYRVTFTANTPPYIYDAKDTKYVDPGEDVKLPPLPENAKWYIGSVGGEEFDGRNIQKDMDAVAGMRIVFAGQTGTVIEPMIYSTEAQTLDLDTYMEYAEGGPVSDGRFEYTITADNDGLKAVLADDGKTLTIPAGTNVKEGGYTLNITAHEKEPIFKPLALGSFGTDDVTLTINIVIEKATPVITIKPIASDIVYGQTLVESTFTGGEAQHPTTGAAVDGIFTWDDNTAVPTVNEAANIGYSVTFTPDDTVNYNTVTTMVTLTVGKVDPLILTAPEGIDRIYNGTAQELIKPGSAEGGTMMYSLEKDGEYSTESPARANADTYEVWYKVFGDENHNDTEPVSITVTISPAELIIPEQTVTYNGSNKFTITLDGVNGEIVVTDLIAYSKDADVYTYASEVGSGNYTAEFLSTNYIVAEGAGTLTISPLPAVLTWSDPLTFTYNGQTREVTATVVNAVDGDRFDLRYENNSYTNVGDYEAKVISLGNPNYTLDNGQNVIQPWHITQETGTVTLLEVAPVTYGDELTLTAIITPAGADDISLMALGMDQVEFSANGKPLGIVSVKYDDSDNDSATVTFTVKATSENNFTAISNAVTAEYSGNSNVTGGKAAITVTVNAKPVTAIITGENTSKTYDGNDIATGFGLELSGVEACDNGNVTAAAETYTYSSADASENLTITANNITLNGSQSGNYVVTDIITATGKITPKPVRLEWSGHEGLVYTGDPVNVTAAATELIPGDECTVTVSNGDQTNADTYTASANSLDNSNYILPENGTTQEYTIAPAPLMIPEQVVSYNGEKTFTIMIDGVKNETVTAVLTASEADAGDYTYGTGAKSYTAGISDTNYIITGGARLTIEKVMPDVIWPSATIYVNDELKYGDLTGGSASGVGSKALDGTFSFSGVNSWAASGTYDVECTFILTDETNYNSVNGKVKVNVIKREVESAAADPAEITNKVYGTAQEELGLPDVVTITTADGKTFENVPVSWIGYDPDTLEEQTLSGILDLSSIDSEVENPLNVTASVTVKLHKLTSGTVIFPDKTDIYSGKPVSHEIADQVNGVTEITYTYEGKDGTVYPSSSDAPKNAGEYIVTAVFEMNGNYDQLDPMTATLTIEPAPLTIPAQTVTYNGNKIFVAAPDGVNGETVTVILTTTEADAGDYTYGTGYKTYTAITSNKNYQITGGEVLTIEKAASSYTPPTAKELQYNGTAQELIEPGSAIGGTMMYSLEKDGEYSTESPARANAGTYKVWYKVVGDNDHNDTEPEFIEVTIRPAELAIPEQTVTYNGSSIFTLALDGVTVEGEETSRTVIATLTAHSKDAGNYGYSETDGEGKYTVELSNSNYIVAEGAGTLTISPLPAVLVWSDPLTFTYNGQTHEVTALVSNGIEGDTFKLTYKNEGKTTNSAIDADDYTAEVIALGNDNYTLENAQNVTQQWYITPEDENVFLVDVDTVVYGDKVTLTVRIEKNDDNSISSFALKNDRVEFFINGRSFEGNIVDVSYSNDDKTIGTASVTINATSQNNFSAGANVVKASYSGNKNVLPEDAFTTVTVVPKPITAKIIGDTNKTYDGNDIAAGLSVELNRNEICDNGSGKDDVTVIADTYTYNSADVSEAATVTANNITLSGEQSGNYVINDPVIISGKIIPKAVRIEWSGYEGLVYTGEPVNVTASATELIPGDECTVTVANGDQTNAGTYTASTISLGNSNYMLPETGTSQEYTIAPAPLTIPAQTVTYNGGTTFTVEDVATGVNGETVTVTLTASEADAGDYTYGTGDKTYTAATSDTNYQIVGGEILTILKDDTGFTPPTAKELTYNGTAQKLVEAGSAEGGMMKYSLKKDGKYFADIPSRTNAGTYEVWYMVMGDGNHNDTEPGSVKVTISPAELIIPAQTVEYNGGKIFTVENVATGVNGETVTVTLTASEADAGDYTYGTGYKTYTAITSNKNYQIVGGEVLTIQKTVPGYTPPTAKELTYNGTAQELIIPGSAEGGTMMYSLEKDGEYSTESPARANAGTYKVWYKVVGDENHSDTEPKFITVTIRPAELTIPAQNVIYNGGNTFTIALDGVTVEGEESSRTVIATLTVHSKDAGNYGYSETDGEGKYTVELSNSNYIVAEGAGTLTISPLPAVLTWSDPLTFTYNGQTHEVTAKVSNGIEGDTFKLTYKNEGKTTNSAIDADDYTAEVIDLGNDNYTLDNGQNVIQLWNIIQETGTVTLLEAAPVTYGDELTLTVKITSADAGNISLMALAADQVEFSANGRSLGIVGVKYDDSDNDSATVTYTVKATSANNFSAGSNAVIAEYSGNSNVRGGKSAITVTVKAKPVTAIITGENTSKTYDGNNIATGLEIRLDGVEACDNGNVTAAADTYTYSSVNASEDLTITANNVTLSGSQSGNYVVTDIIAATGKITPKAVRIEWSGYEGLVYTGEPVNVTASATELIPGDECTVTVANGDQTNAGTYTASTISLGNSNYMLPETGTSQEYTIAPAPLAIPAQTVSYNGDKTFTFMIDGVKNDTVTVTLTASEADAGDYTYGTGDKTYTASTDDTNYQIIGGATLTIEKVDPSYTAPTAKELQYNGTAQELVEPGSAEGGTMEYSLSEDGEYSADIPTGIKAGTYTVWYRIVGDKNHNDIAPRSVEVTITSGSSADPTDPEDPTDPTGPTGPTGPSGPTSPGGSVDPTDQNNPTDLSDNAADDKNNTEDVSASASEYAADEKIGTVSAVTSVNKVMIIPVIAALVFILKRKYAGQKSRH